MGAVENAIHFMRRKRFECFGADAIDEVMGGHLTLHAIQIGEGGIPAQL